MNYWDQIRQACDLLDSDQVVGIPTETVYGLAGSIQSSEALENIFRVKKRPYFDPLIVHVADKEMAKTLCREWPEIAERLADRFWPGPMTLVLPKASYVSDRITSGLDSVGLRVPGHPFARRVIREVGAFAAPSANMFGKTSPTSAAHVREEFQNEIFVLDGGPCEIGLESTVLGVHADEIQIFRPGMISFDELKNFVEHLDFPVKLEYRSSEAAPGQLKQHYQPKIPLVLLDKDLSNKEVCEKLSMPSDSKIFHLELGEDAFIAARDLYSQLRKASESQHDLILVRWPFKNAPEIWTALRDRLEKAATLILT